MMQRNKFRKHFWSIPLFVLVAGLILGGAVKFLWNAILPTLLNVNPITYWQAVGLLALCRILLGNFGGRMRNQGPGWKQPQDNQPGGEENPDPSMAGPPWRRGSWMKMSDDERSKFKAEMRRRCGNPPEL
ncbi:hypothetical protein [Dyadobacter sp. 32]|uniref:hypothetical protein n=1 Tax=Dyadobacter sp. 32 TaxID=538966 RepID=UPI0039C5BB92